MISEEKRAHRRVVCEIDSSFKNIDVPASRPSEAVVSDISEGGLRFRANDFIPVHHRLLFRLNIPGKKTLEALVQPAWIREIPSLSQFDIGVKFLSLTTEDKELIREYVSSARAVIREGF